MIEITREQLRGLTGVQLRELVARLCEAELRARGAPASAVRWSGAHSAPDGGLDVECRVEDRPFQGDFVPRPRTGFQVKKPSMPPSKIAPEMSPKGRLRPVFSTLAADNGCYIIVSLADNPTGSTALKRQETMREQLEPMRSHGDLRTDFYGRSELANWLRQHPGVQLWVRDKLGIPLEGWKPLGRWTNTPLNDSDELICKPGVSISLLGRGATRLDIGQGIQAIRDLLRTSDRAVRIVGLSGVGKTRILQALFEGSVGADPLDRSLAIYADLGTNPIPTPSQVVARLKAEGQPAILVLDNCPADAHSLLAAEVSGAPRVRLITVEYDIREDKPEVTTVIRIDAEGIGIVEVLVSRRYPALGQRNARRIAEFSGGNARVALALANALEDNEDLSDFSDAQLFARLFHQRGTPDEHLLVAARTLALVYSYSVASDETGVDELATLAGLIGQTRQKLYAATHTLLERQLAQQRGYWRAILPPAVANRLAASGLDDIPTEELRNTLETLPNDRLLKSFGKRLGYPETDDEDSRRAIEFLDELDDLLRPARLPDQIRVYVCDVGHRQFSVLDECDDDPRSQEECSRKAASRAYDLGLAACRDLEAVEECSQELFTGETGFLADFGKGMASEYDEPRFLWDRLVGYLQITEGVPTHCAILCGALDGIHERDEALAKRILRESAANPALRPFIARLHLSVPVSCESIGTFLRALGFDDTPLDQFATLAWQRPPQALPEALIRDLFAEILQRPRGPTIVLTGMSRRIRQLEVGQLTFGSDLKRLGLIALTATLRNPSNPYNHADHRHLPDVLAFCLDEAEFPQEATQVLDAFLARMNGPYAIMAGLRAAAAILAEKMPFRFLDGVCLDPALEDHYRRRLFTEPRRGTSPLADVDEGTLIEWCRRGDFEERLTALSQAVHPFAPGNDGKGVVFSGQARAILHATQNPGVILGNFANSIRPNGWSGSLADIIAERCRPFEALRRDDRSHVRIAARNLLPRIKEWEHQERQDERDRARQRDQRFE